MGLFHLSVDFLSLAPLALALSSGSPIGEGTLEASFLYLAYLAFAFLFQAPLGALMDHRGKGDGRKAASFSLVFLLLGALIVFLPRGLASFLPTGDWSLVLTSFLGAMVLGAGNALFHVGAGRHLLLLGAGPDHLGAFISFGSIAVYLTSSSFRGLAGGPILVLLLYVLFLILGLSLALWLLIGGGRKIEVRNSPLESASFSGNPEELLYFVLFLLLSVFLRGFVGSYKESSSDLLYLVAMAGVFLGKLLGGYLVRLLGSLSLLVLMGASYVLGLTLPSGGGMADAFLLSLATNLPMGLTLSLSGRAFGKGKEGFAFGILSTILGLGTGLGAFLAPLGTDARLAAGLMGLNILFLFLSLLFIGRGRLEELFPRWERKPRPSKAGEEVSDVRS